MQQYAVFFWTLSIMQSDLFHCNVILVNPCISQYDLHWRLQLQFLVLLMTGAVTPETCYDFAVK